jgi:hypothetical protein
MAIGGKGRVNFLVNSPLLPNCACHQIRTRVLLATGNAVSSVAQPHPSHQMMDDGGARARGEHNNAFRFISTFTIISAQSIKLFQHVAMKQPPYQSLPLLHSRTMMINPFPTSTMTTLCYHSTLLRRVEMWWMCWL